MLDDREALKLRKAVSYYLYIASKDVPDEQGALFRAAALALIKKPVDASLIHEVLKRRSDEEPLYKLDVDLELEDLWEQHHKRHAA
jgi:hypothetical protein